MEATVSKSQFKPKALEYFRSVETTGKELVITDHGRPVLRIIPWAETPGSESKLSRNTAARSSAPSGAVAPPGEVLGQDALRVRMPRPGGPLLGEVALPPPTPLPVDIVSLLLEDRGSGR